MRGTVVIDAERCKGCGLCVLACPQQVLHLGEHYNSRGYRSIVLDEGGATCTGCGVCAVVCPDVAFSVYRAVRVPAQAAT